MGLDIQKLAATAFSIGKSLGDQAFETVTARLDPTTTPDPINNTAGTVWAHTFTGIQALGFEDSDERKDRASKKKMKTWLLDRADIVAAATAAPNVLDQEGQVEDSSGTIWEAYRAEYDPTRSAILLYCEA